MQFQILLGVVEAMEEELKGKRLGYDYCEFWNPKLPEIRKALLKASRRRHKVYNSPARKAQLLAVVKRVDAITKKFKERNKLVAKVKKLQEKNRKLAEGL